MSPTAEGGCRGTVPPAQLLSRTTSHIPSLGLLVCYTPHKRSLRWDLLVGDSWLRFPLLGWCAALISQDFSWFLKKFQGHLCALCWMVHLRQHNGTSTWAPEGSSHPAADITPPGRRSKLIPPPAPHSNSRARERQHTVCYKTCTRTSVPLRGLSSEENK